jgi:hypothetical protein
MKHNTKRGRTNMVPLKKDPREDVPSRFVDVRIDVRNITT